MVIIIIIIFFIIIIFNWSIEDDPCIVGGQCIIPDPISLSLHLQDKLLKIAIEAEQVSVSIFGESMSPEEQQDRMWADGTVSVWDLEMQEQQAEVMGETMPWHGEMDEQIFLDKMQENQKRKEGFDEKGVKKIGGY